MIKTLIIAVLLLFAATGGATAWERGGHGGGHWGGGGGFSGQRGGGGGFSRYGGWGHGPRYFGGGDILGGIAGGIIGGAIGSIFAPDPEPPVVVVVPPAQEPLEPFSPQWRIYCQGRYKSFEQDTGFFTGYDGKKYMCH